MDRKGSRLKRTHPERQKKRRYHGKKRVCDSSSSSSGSASAKKLKKGSADDILLSDDVGYCLISFSIVFSQISRHMICRECKNDMIFHRTAEKGLGFQIAMKCKCGEYKFYSTPVSNHQYDVNQRLVLVFRLLGIGFTGLNLFCGMMDMSLQISNSLYYKCVGNLYNASKTVCDIITRKAVEEEVELCGKREVSVSGDRTWNKRGFSSLFGVATLIGKETGKVFDIVIKSSFCQACNLWRKKFDTEEELNDWLEEHKDECTNNHNGNAEKMEVDAVTEMFKRSEEKYNVKYTEYIGDGDCKTFNAILQEKPYGDTIVKKSECVNHVEKRMGTRLRKAKKEHKNIGGKGKGKLTAKVVKELTTYYGLALRRNANSVENMKNAVWATYYHKSSTNENPQHHFCPSGADSWCTWRQAEANGTLSEYEHELPLSDTVLVAIKPIYEDLSRDDLLQRCVGANTQNNESLIATIWNYTLQHIYSGKAVIEISRYLATCIFNGGILFRVKHYECNGSHYWFNDLRLYPSERSRENSTRR